MNVLARLDDYIADLEFAFRIYKERGDRDRAVQCYHQREGMRLARRIVIRAADELEKAA